MCPPVFFENQIIPQKNETKYLGLHLDKKLSWEPHLRIKRNILTSRLKQLYRLVNRNSKLPISSKLLLYKSLLKPIWTYGIQIFGTAKNSHIKKIQVFQSKYLRLISGAPYYVSNKTLHTDFKLKFVKDVAKEHYQKFFRKLNNHTNPLVQALNSNTLPGNPRRRLKRKWSRDML